METEMFKENGSWLAEKTFRVHVYSKPVLFQVPHSCYFCVHWQWVGGEQVHLCIS